MLVSLKLIDPDEGLCECGFVQSNSKDLTALSPPIHVVLPAMEYVIQL